MGSIIGDLPHFFYTLRVEPWMYPFFVFEGIMASDLVVYAREKGVIVDVPPGMDYIAVAALLMGWNWAPWVANTLF